MVNIKVKKTSLFSFNKSKHVLFDTNDEYHEFIKLFEISRDEASSSNGTN